LLDRHRFVRQTSAYHGTSLTRARCDAGFSDNSRGEPMCCGLNILNLFRRAASYV